MLTNYDVQYSILLIDYIQTVTIVHQLNTSMNKVSV